MKNTLFISGVVTTEAHETERSFLMEKNAKPAKNRTLQLVIMALMVALIFIFSRFLGINSDIIHVGFDFLPALVVACLYGPVWAAVTYMIGDLVCAIGMPIGMLNPGITLMAGLIGLTYGIFFYNRNPEGKKLMAVTIAASLVVAGIIKLFGTTACLAFAYGSPYWPTLISRIPTCLILFVIQVITIPLIYRYVVIPVSRRILR